MTPRAPLRPSFALLLAAVAIVLVGAAPPLAAAPAGVDTSVALIVGFPGQGSTPGERVIIVPGMVIPVDQLPAAGTDATRRAALARGDDSGPVAELAERLATTLRLGRTEVRHRDRLLLAAGETRRLPPVAPSSTVHAEVSLIGLEAGVATYRVAFRQGDTVLVDNAVSVETGKRAVVGGLDGPEAPYLFLVLEPIPAGRPRSPRHLEPGSGVVAPNRIEATAPTYPEAAREEKIEGIVVLTAVIDERGRIQEVTVLQGVDPLLDQAALEAVKSWRFEPATLDGEPVSVYYNLTINFRLD